jgi:hypothetical protein
MNVSLSGYLARQIEQSLHIQAAAIVDGVIPAQTSVGGY